MATVLVLSGVSTRATLDEFAYRPSVVLDGVGDIPRLAQQGGQRLRRWHCLLLAEKVLSAARRMPCFLTLHTMVILFLRRSTSAAP